MTPSHFDNVASQWDSPSKTNRARVFAEEIARHVTLAPETVLLEFGCGTGLVSMYFQPHVTQVHLVDTSQGMLDIVQEKMAQDDIRNMTLHCGEIAELDLPHAHFDLIYTLMALHHVRDIAPVLQAFHTLLKPGGTLCIGDLEEEDGSFHGPNADVHKGFDTGKLGKMLARAGFTAMHSQRMDVIEKQDAGGKAHAYPVFFLSARRVTAAGVCGRSFKLP